MAKLAMVLPSAARTRVELAGWAAVIRSTCGIWSDRARNQPANAPSTAAMTMAQTRWVRRRSKRSLIGTGYQRETPPVRRIPGVPVVSTLSLSVIRAAFPVARRLATPHSGAARIGLWSVLASRIHLVYNPPMAICRPSADHPPRTVAETVYRNLRRDIITLRHRPGTSLTEQELATLYGSSRVPVREACRRLQQEGLLTAVPYKGYFVSQISLREIEDSFDLRELLETHAAARAIVLATPEELAHLEELATTGYTYNDWSSYGDFLERNREFHVCLAALGGNERLVCVLDELLGTMQRFFFLGLDLADFSTQMRHEHEGLIEALRQRSADEVTQRVREQIDSSRRRVRRALERGGIDLPLEPAGPASRPLPSLNRSRPGPTSPEEQDHESR